ncbi:MAG: LacI family DNA-binding transcriptional regulator [Trebonia sp.]
MAVRPPRRATLDEVARLARVSPSTVSRVVRGSTPVSPELESAVREAIRVTGYVPNLAARQLVTSRSDAVGVVIPEDQWRVFRDPFFADMVEGVATQLASTHYRVILVMGRSAEDPEWLLNYVGGGHVDGVMLIAPERHHPLGDAIRSAGVPVVYMGKPFQETEDARYVDADNAGGVRQAVEYLYGQGRRRIALIAGVPTMRSSVDRTAGYRSGMASVGLPVDERLVLATDYGDEAGEKAMNQLLRLGESVGVVDAVIAASDLIAIGVLRSLRTARIDVPGDIAVIGFGDERIAARSEPPLTTIAHNATQMGKELARLMLAVLEGQQDPGCFIMPPRLVVRATA